jgi:NTP pyrophosphatase (non-canonical NTP hydrolase)
MKQRHIRLISYHLFNGKIKYLKHRIIIMANEVKEFFSTYSDFVTKVTSDPSLEMEALKASLDDIESKSNIEIPRLLTAALGLGSETGEFVEIVKKMILQGKPASEENIFHMKRELGDIMWYWTTACASLGLDPFEVIMENQKKLEARYGEKFEIKRSEVRKEGDL